MKCIVEACPCKYTNVRSLKTHLQRKHSQMMAASEIDKTEVDNTGESVQLGNSDNEDMGTDMVTLASQDLLKREVVRYSLNIREIYIIPS